MNPTWFEKAVCRDFRDFTEWTIQEQIAMCASCPVTGSCLAYGEATGSVEVVYGGMLMPTIRDRQRQKREG